MMVVTSAIQNKIRENKIYTINSDIQTGRKYGMFLLDESLFQLWRNGTCEKEEVLMRSSNPGDLARKIAQAEKGQYKDKQEVEVEVEDEHDELDDQRPPRRRA
jgi:twitching motility protein PilT